MTTTKTQKPAHAIQLLGYRHITGEIYCETGLRVGGSSEIIEIGGLDNPVIKHPGTGEPYIPGSSLKGKMRSLLELYLGLIRANGNVHTCRKMDCPVCRIFGVSGSEGSLFGPGRLIVRDARILSEEKKKRLSGNQPCTEIKYENTIDRIKGTAAHPRQMERVPSGTRFSFDLSYRIFSVQETNKSEPDNGATDKKIFERVLDCLHLLQNDTLGGSGSRGYGQVSFRKVKVLDLDGSEKEQVNITGRTPEPPAARP